MKSVKTLTLSVLATAALLASVLAAPASASASAAGMAGAAEPTRCSLAEFDSAKVERDSGSGSFILIVSGMKRATNVTIELTPVVYIQQPDYWLILVHGCESGIGMQILTPYTAKRDITATIGTVGIDVQGSNQHMRIPLGPRSTQGSGH